MVEVPEGIPAILPIAVSTAAFLTNGVFDPPAAGRFTPLVPEVSGFAGAVIIPVVAVVAVEVDAIDGLVL